MRNLKKFKVSIIGILALVTAVALNMRHAFNDYGIKDNKLHVQILAQSSSSGNGSSSGSSNGNGTDNGGTTDSRPKEVPSTSSKVSCHFQGTLSNSNSSSSSNSSSWSFSGSVGGNWGPFNGNLGADFGKDSSGKEGTWAYGSVNVDYKLEDATRIDCKATSTASCTKMDPCMDAIKEFRNLIQ
jgi:hypothetical protein